MERILLVNPPIYDFSAYDYWLKPLGLLYLASILKSQGKKVFLIDAMDRHDPYFKDVKDKWFGTGKFYSERIEKPDCLKKVPLHYKRYGLPQAIIRERIKEIKPDMVLVSVTMAYWYPGAVEILRTVKEIDRDLPVFLGGVYPTLIKEHAETLGFDRIFTLSKLHEFAGLSGIKIPESFKDYPPPDFSLYTEPTYGVLTTSLGCPFRCSYCASGKLYPVFQAKEPESVIEEIEMFGRMGIRDIAFYDDALLFPAERFIKIFEHFTEKQGFRFHTPNGLHVRFITKEIAEIMKKSGFIQPRVSLETTSTELQKKTGSKVFTGEFETAFRNLLSAGYKPNEITGYIMFGLPEQTFKQGEEDILYLAKLGVRIYLSEFSPVPGTDYYNLPDPLMSNNSAYLYIVGRGKELELLKNLKREMNQKVTTLA